MPNQELATEDRATPLSPWGGSIRDVFVVTTEKRIFLKKCMLRMLSALSEAAGGSRSKEKHKTLSQQRNEEERGLVVGERVILRLAGG